MATGRILRLAVDQSFLIGLVVGGLAVAVLAFRASAGEGHLRRVSRLEAKLDALLKHGGIEFDPYAGAPPAVVEALRRGKKIEAIKEFRAATGVGLREAKDFVEELQRRSP